MAKTSLQNTQGGEIKKKSDGFTIIELMVATTVFSVVLLVVTTGIIRIGQIYYKNLTLNRTQETVRTVGDDIAQTIQFANGQKRNGSAPNQFCIGDVRYTFNLNTRINTDLPSPGDGLKADRITPSTPCAAPGAPGTELLSNNMRLLKFNVNPADAQSKTWRIEIVIAYGEDDLLTHYDNNGTPVGWSAPTEAAVQDATCKTGISGGSFCATSRLDTLVKRRLN